MDLACVILFVFWCLASEEWLIFGIIAL